MGKGYSSEYDAKKQLEERYGKGFVIKVAVSQQAPDFIYFEKTTDSFPFFEVRAVEVKGRKTPYFYMNKHDRKQFHVFKEWSETTGIPVDYWLRTIVKGKAVWERLSLEEFGKVYVERRVNGNK